MDIFLCVCVKCFFLITALQKLYKLSVFFESYNHRCTATFSVHSVYVMYTYIAFRKIFEHFFPTASLIMITDCISQAVNAVGSVRPSIRLFRLLAFEHSDLRPWSFACLQIMTTAHLMLKVRVKSQNAVGVTPSEHIYFLGRIVYMHSIIDAAYCYWHVAWSVCRSVM